MDPTAKIRTLLHDSECGIIGNVVNIGNSLNKEDIIKIN